MKHKGVEATWAQVRHKVDTFVSECLDAGYDIIVPVESEGLSVLLHNLPERWLERVIPSSWLPYLHREDFEGKRVIIIDASVEVGRTLQQQVRDFTKRFGFVPDQTAIVAHAGFPEKRFAKSRVKPLRLDSNRYVWAKECLADLELLRVFVHSGDPPLWEFSYPEEFSAELAREVVNLGTAYSVGAVNGWERISLDLISPLDTDWAPEEAHLSSVCKIRVLLHHQEPVLRVLPLIFPSIPVDAPLDFQRYFDRAKTSNENMPSALARYAEDGTRTPERTFRWIAAYGSLLLLEDFLARLRTFLPAECSLTLEPTPTCKHTFRFYDPDFGDNLYDCAYQRIERLLRPPRATLQTSLPRHRFAFRILSSQEIQGALAGSNGKEEGGITTAMLLEDAFSRLLLEQKRATGAKRETLERTFPELQKLLHGRATVLALSRALDILVDEAVLRPRIGRRPVCGSTSPNSEYVQRTYASAGELVRHGLLVHAMATSE